MAGDAQSIERLREYLQTLDPHARARLVAELERGGLRGEEDHSNQIVLNELRRLVDVRERPAPSFADAARPFFAPLEPFLIDGAAEHGRAGRIARVSLNPIWQWIGRDLMPADFKAVSEDIDLSPSDRNTAQQVAGVLQSRAVPKLRSALQASASDEKARRQFAVQVGTPRAALDLAAILAILTLRDVLADMASWLPEEIRTLDTELIDQVTVALETAAEQMSRDINKANVLLYGLLLVMNRLDSPWELIRIPIHVAKSDDCARIAATPYAFAVGVVFGEIEHAVSEFRTEFKAGRPVASLLKSIHDGARGLRSELDLSGDTPWARQLAAIRSDVSDLLKYALDATPGQVRRLLRPRPAKDIRAGSVLDALDVAEAATRVELVTVCRNYAGELAVNEAALRAYSDLKSYLENGTKALLESLRHAGTADRPFRRSQVDAAIRFCGTIFGADYAGLLAKAADVADQSVGPELRQIKA